MSPADLIRAWSKAERDLYTCLDERVTDGEGRSAYLDRFSVRAFAEMDARKALHAWADANPDTGTHCEHCGTTGCAVCGVAA